MPIRISKNRVALSGVPLNLAAEADIASAATTAIGAAASNNVRITGTTTIISLGTADAGITRNVRFVGVLTLTHNAASLILPGRGNITTAANDTAEFLSLGSGNWICTAYKGMGFVILSGGSYTAPRHPGALIFSNYHTEAPQGAAANTHTRIRFNADGVQWDDYSLWSAANHGFLMPGTLLTAAFPFDYMRFAFRVDLAAATSSTGEIRTAPWAWTTDVHAGHGGLTPYWANVATGPSTDGAIKAISGQGFGGWIPIEVSKKYGLDVFHNDITSAGQAVTFANGTDTVTYVGADNWENLDPVKFFCDVYPSGVTTSVYFIRNLDKTTKTFQISTTDTGAIVTFTTDGSGTRVIQGARTIDQNTAYFAIEFCNLFGSPLVG